MVRFYSAIKQNVRFQVRIYCKQIQIDQIKNGLPAATSDVNIRDN